MNRPSGYIERYELPMIWLIIIPVGIVIAAIVGSFFMAFYAAAIINNQGDQPLEYGKYIPVDWAKPALSRDADRDLDHNRRMSQDLHTLAVHILAAQPDPQPPKICDTDKPVHTLQ